MSLLVEYLLYSVSLGITVWLQSKPVFRSSDVVEALVIYSVCKCATRPSGRYLMREKKRKDLVRICKPPLGSKAKHLPPKQSVKFKCV